MALLRGLLVLVVVTGFVAGAEAASVGSPAPTVRLSSLGERSVDLAELRGRVVVLDFWATWCPPCVEQLTALDAFAAEHPDTEIVVVAVSIDDTEETAEEYLRERIGAVRFRAAHDPNGTALADFGADGVPALYVIDAQGVVRATHFGPGCAEGLWSDVQPLLAGGSGSVSDAAAAE